MSNLIRTITAEDKAFLAVSLLNAGIKARVRQFPGMVRLVSDAPVASIAAVLNDCGFRNAAGQAFDRFSFDGNQAFVRYMEA